MQTLDVQKEMQPIQYTEAVQSSNPDKKTIKEPDRRSASFLEMIKKLVKDAPEGYVEKTESGKTAEVSLHKQQTAVRTELSRFKIKNGQNRHDTQAIKAEDAAQEFSLLQDAVDQDILLACSDTSVDLKNVIDLNVEDDRRSALPFETEQASDEEVASLLSEDTLLRKKHKSGTQTGFGTETAAQAPVSAREESKRSKEPDFADGLDKQIKSAQQKQHKPVFTVIDERTAQFAPVSADGSVHEAGTAVRVENGSSVDMVMDFRGTPAGFTAKAEGGLFAKESGGQTFSALVAQQVQDMSADFVQAGKIVLQDNNAGLIRLQLQPAHLGNVRINLELAGDKRITGKIITGSKEAYEAFKESIEQLAEAFEQGGFSSAQFDVSWSGESGGQQFAEGDSSFTESFLQNERLEVMQNSRYADTQTVYSFGQDQAVNVFA